MRSYFLYGSEFTDIDVDGIHGFLVEPPAPRPHPAMFLARCNNLMHVHDSYSPVVQSWVDHGFAVVLVNYRGTVGFGRAWRDAHLGNPGLAELADLARVHDWIVASGIADPARIVLGGESWGGYLTLLGLGVQPERWALGIAETPVGDFVACYEDVMEPLRVTNRLQFGGSPAEVPEVWWRASPITYVEQVRAPVLIIAGEHDSRCPMRQIEHYVARLQELAKPHELYRFDWGHFMWETEERLRQAEAKIAFAARYLGTSSPS